MKLTLDTRMQATVALHVLRWLAAISITLGVLFSPASAADAEIEMVLSPAALGPLTLRNGASVSEELLKKLFPSLTVKYEIAQGDSPDFHYFEVSSPKGEILFSIQSFIDESAPSKKTTSAVPIQLLQIYSRKIKDSYGLRVGDRVQDIIRKRGKALSFGAAHHDVHVGAGKIYYSLATGRESSPESFTLNDAVKGNWKIRAITWPEAAWD